MAMCKECKSVVGVDEIENGICNACISEGKAVAVTPEIDPAQEMFETLTRLDFKNPFSFRGRSGRLDYLVYGVLLTYMILFFGVYMGIKMENTPVVVVSIVLGGIIGLAATVRRARDREENIVLLILLSLIPYLGFLVLLYLLLAPSKRKKAVKIESEEKI